MGESMREAANEGVNGNGEWLEADPGGEKVNIDGFVSRDMNKGVVLVVILRLNVTVNMT